VRVYRDQKSDLQTRRGQRDISDELSKKISEVEKTKNLFGLNNLLKTEVIFLKQESPISISNKEASRFWVKMALQFLRTRVALAFFRR